MAYLSVIQCRGNPGMMQDFTTAVQAWEQDALRDDDAPEYHAVYLGAAEAERILIISHFASREQARRFAERGHMTTFRHAVLDCVVDDPKVIDGWDLYYAATPDGPVVTFGEDTHPHD